MNPNHKSVQVFKSSKYLNRINETTNTLEVNFMRETTNSNKYSKILFSFE
jgi:hypothetical protein